MAYWFDRNFNTEDGWRAVVRRSLETLLRVAIGFFAPGEMMRHYFDPDTLGVWIGVCNTRRPELLLREINEKAFPTFAFNGMTFDGHTYWTHFRAV